MSMYICMSMYVYVCMGICVCARTCTYLLFVTCMFHTDTCCMCVYMHTCMTGRIHVAIFRITSEGNRDHDRDRDIDRDRNRDRDRDHDVTVTVCRHLEDNQISTFPVGAFLGLPRLTFL